MYTFTYFPILLILNNKTHNFEEKEFDLLGNFTEPRATITQENCRNSRLLIFTFGE